MENTLNFIKERINGKIPEIALVLGSGLGDFTDNMNGIEIPYSDIEGFPSSNVAGHKGSLFFCELYGKNILIMQGRFHYYEGNSPKDMVFPIKVFKKLGVKKIILTNAAGTLDKKFTPGDLMLILDHINFMGINPLIGKNDDNIGERFPDMSQIYDIDLRNLALDCAKKNNIELKQGVYAATTGPSYETPSEVKMLKLMGADVVGMSTVPEAIVANWAGMRVLAISLITNYASGVGNSKLSHNEVLSAGKTASGKIKALMNSILENI